MKKEEQAWAWIISEVSRRRRDMGFRQEVPRECWRDPGVHSAVSAAMGQLLCHPAGDWAEMADASDGELCDALDDVNAALNGMTLYRPDFTDAPIYRPREGSTFPALMRRPPSPRKAGSFERGSTPYDVEGQRCADALGDFLAWQLSQDALVKDFRRSALHDRLLTEKAAWEFITSPLAQILTVEDFERHGLCPAAATGRVIMPKPDMELRHMIVLSKIRREEDKAPSLWVELDVELNLPDGQPFHQPMSFSMMTYCTLGLAARAPALPNTEWGCYESEPFAIEPALVPYFEERDEEKFVEGWNQSVSSDAIAAVGHLVTDYPVEIWELLRFLLTGLPPRVQPIFATQVSCRVSRMIYKWFERLGEEDLDWEWAFQADGPCSLSVQPWVQPEELAEHWRQIRPATAPRTLPKEHNLALFRFVLKNTPPGAPFRWEELAGKWRGESGQPMNSEPDADDVQAGAGGAAAGVSGGGMIYWGYMKFARIIWDKNYYAARRMRYTHDIAPCFFSYS